MERDGDAWWLHVFMHTYKQVRNRCSDMLIHLIEEGEQIKSKISKSRQLQVSETRQIGFSRGLRFLL